MTAIDHRGTDTSGVMGRYHLAALFSALFVVGISFGAAAPLVSSILEERGFSEYYTGAVAAILALAIAVFSPLAGRLVDRHGVRRLVLWGMLAQALCFAGLGLALATHEHALFLARMMLGASATMTFVAAEVALLRSVPPESRGRIMSVYGVAMGAGYAAGVFVAAIAYEHTGLWAFALVGLMAATFTPVAAWGLRHQSMPKPSPQHTEVAGIGHGRPGLWPLIALGIYGAVVFGGVDTAMSGTFPIEAHRIGLERGQIMNIIGVLFIGTLLAQPVTGWMADRFGARPAMLSAAIIGLLGCLGAAWAGLNQHSAMLFFSWFWVGWAAGAAYPVGLKVLGDRCPPGMLATANARYSGAYGYASLFGPMLAAGGIDLAGRLQLQGSGVPLVFSSIFVFLFALIWWDRRRNG